MDDLQIPLRVGVLIQDVLDFIVGKVCDNVNAAFQAVFFSSPFIYSHPLVPVQGPGFAPPLSGQPGLVQLGS